MIFVSIKFYVHATQILIKENLTKMQASVY